MMDVGSNLGFYSLLDSKFGYRTMTFDPSTSCLYSTQGMAKINQLSDKIVLNNVGARKRKNNVKKINVHQMKRIHLIDNIVEWIDHSAAVSVHY